MILFQRKIYKKSISGIHWVLFCIFVAFQLLPKNINAEYNPACSEALFEMSNPNDPLRYKLRGDRCEGRYLNPSGSYLHIVSLTQSFESYDLESSEELTLDWGFPATKPIFIRAFSIAPNIYYRMDTSRSQGLSLYHWPMSILSTLKINSQNLGVIAWMNLKLAGENQKVHIPLCIGETKKADVPKKIEVIFQSASRLSEVYYSLSEMDFQGRNIRLLVDGKALEQGFYPKMKGVRFFISEISDPGLYCLVISAIQQSGVNSDPTELWLYYGGDPSIVE